MLAQEARAGAPRVSGNGAVVYAGWRVIGSGTSAGAGAFAGVDERVLVGAEARRGVGRIPEQADDLWETGVVAPSGGSETDFQFNGLAEGSGDAAPAADGSRPKSPEVAPEVAPEVSNGVADIGGAVAAEVGGMGTVEAPEIRAVNATGNDAVNPNSASPGGWEPLGPEITAFCAALSSHALAIPVMITVVGDGSRGAAPISASAIANPGVAFSRTVGAGYPSDAPVSPGIGLSAPGPNPMPGSLLISTSTYTSSNWSGYFAFANTAEAFSEIATTFTVPTLVATGASTTYSAFWVGFDGVSDSTVEQCGILGDITPQGQATYFAWYELFPAYAVEITNFTVNPGDVITAEVAFSRPSTYTFTLEDLTDEANGQSYMFSEGFSSPGDDRSTAEWIAEAPGIDGEQSSMADFGSVTFSDDMANLTGSLEPLGSLSPNDIELTQNNDLTLTAIPSAISGGDSFTIDFIPEPSPVLLVLGGIVGLAMKRRRSPRDRQSPDWHQPRI